MVDLARSFDNSLDPNRMRERGPWFFAIFDKAPLAMALTRVPDGVTVDVNEAFEKLFELSREEVLGRTSSEVGISDPESRERVAAELRDRGKVQDFECVRLTKAGARVVLQLNVDPIDVEGEAYVLTSVRDITRASSAADELRALVDNLPELAWTARPDGFLDFYNRRWYEYTGTTLEAMQGWGWQSVHDPIELPRVMESWTRSIATQQPFDQTFPLRRKDGVFRWFLTRVVPMFDGAGSLIRWVGVNTDIDDQRRDQQAAHEAEQRFRLLFESAPVGMIKMSADGRIILVNAQIEALFGYAREDLAGQPIEKLVPARFRGHHPEYRTGFLAYARSRAMGRGRELYGLRKDGSEVAVEIGLNPLRTPDGIAVLSSVVDVSERKRAEQERINLGEQLQELNANLEERVRDRTSELSQMLHEREGLLREKTSLLEERQLAIVALRASEADFRLLAESMPQIVWITQPDGKNIYFNEHWMSFTGLTLEESLGDGWIEPFHPDDKERAWDEWQAATARTGSYSLECRLRRADGVYCWWLIRGVPILDASGSVRKWFGTCTDIDAVKRSAESAQQQMAALVESADDAIIIKGLDSIIHSWNPGATRLLGYSAEESVGHPVTMLIPEDRLDEETRILAQISIGKHVRHFETLRKRKDGSLVEVSISVSPIRDRSGGVVAASKIMRDITGRNRAEQERMRLLDQLMRVNTELSALNGALEQRVWDRTAALTATLNERDVLLQEIHHRVKNNLSVIGSLMEMQARRLPHDKSRDALEECSGRVHAIALLHEKLYQSENYADVRFAEYLRSLANDVFQATGASPSSVSLTLAVDELPITVDMAIPCGLILNELISNALKHAFPHGRPGTIRVEFARVAEGQLRLSVSDDGVGLPAGFSLGDTKSLGLRLVATLARQLDATLTVCAAVRGATFELMFSADG